MGDYLYGLDSLWVALGLLVAMALGIECGHALGRRRAPTCSEALRTQVNATQASMLGLLALVLGFTFSVALDRYDRRSTASTDEAIAIGTTVLRAQMLSGGIDQPVLARLREYVDLRVAETGTQFGEGPQRRELLQRTQQCADELSQLARNAVDHDGSPVRTGLFVQSLHAMFDAFTANGAVMARHVPGAVLWLLFAVLVLTSVTLGFSSGLGGHRPLTLTWALTALLVLVVFLILDLDRPRRGIIRLRYDTLLDVQASLRVAAEAPTQPGTGR